MGYPALRWHQLPDMTSQEFEVNVILGWLNGTKQKFNAAERRALHTLVEKLVKLDEEVNGVS